MARYDIEAIRLACAGRWPSVIAALTPISPDILNGDHHTCPKACTPNSGGKDRFNFDREGKGGVFCNQCKPGGTGDGIGTIEWMLGVDCATACELVAKHVGVAESTAKKTKKDPAANLQFLEWNRSLAALWCIKKKPITPEAIQAIGGRLAKYRKQHLVIAIPVWGEKGEKVKPVGWVIYAANGGLLPRWKAGTREPEMVKVKLTDGSQPGFIGRLSSEVKRVVKLEGSTDLLAFLSLPDLPADVGAFTNANGALEKPKDWILSKLAGLQVFVIHDADRPGQNGATWVGEPDGRRRKGWCPTLAGIASEVRNVQLPFTVEEVHGQDVRDWIRTGITWKDFESIIATGEVFAPAVDESGEQSDLEEEEDNPDRLARINLHQYETKHGGRLIFWRDEFWKWKAGKYRPIGQGELRAKVWQSIRAEFTRCWESRKGKGEKAIRKVTRTLVNNVIGAMESIVSIPSTVTMPCWLPDRSQPHYVSALNGILDMDAIFSGKDFDDCLLPHSPEWLSAFRLDYQFDPDADAPLFLRFLQISTQGDQEKINLLQEWAGYLLTGQNDLQKFLVLEGEGGNGKTVFFAAMTAMLGAENVSSVTLEDMGKQFALSCTYGKAANISGDIGELDQLAEGILKQFTGGDPMMFERKRENGFMARPTAKLMAAWNTRPRIKDKSDGLWRRMILVPFNHKVTREERVKGMDDSAWWISQGEVPGILNWAIVGLDRLRQQGEFTDPITSQEVANQYRIDSNPTGEFIRDYIAAGEGSIECGILYKLYKFWSVENGHKPMANSNFGKELTKFVPSAERRRVRDGKKLIWKYEGINFLSEEICGKNIDGSENLF